MNSRKLFILKPLSDDESEKYDDISDEKNPTYEVVAGSDDRSAVRVGVPAATRFSAMLMVKNARARKTISKKRFANLVRRNSVQLKIGKGCIDSLIFHLGDSIATNTHVPAFMRDGSIMDTDLEKYCDHIIKTYANHITVKRLDQCTKGKV